MTHIFVVEELVRRYFPSPHPAQRFEREIRSYIRARDRVVDVGCGRYAPLLHRLLDTEADSLTGIDPEIDLSHVSQHRLCAIRGKLPGGMTFSQSQNLVISQGVMEHLADPLAVYREIHRMLVPGGRFLFLTPNLWHWTALISWLTTNAWHPWIVRHTEGRAEQDTFSVCYRANTEKAIRKLAQASGFIVERLEHWDQPPSYLERWPLLFAAGTAYERLVVRRWPWLRCCWLFGILRSL